MRPAIPLGVLVIVGACDATKPDPIPATVTVQFTASTIDPGDTARASVTALDAGGRVINSAGASWLSSNITVARVDSTGKLTGVSEGSADITATVRGVSGTAPFTVFYTVATVGVTPGRATIEADDTTGTTVAVASAKGVAISGRAVSYTTSNAAVATVSAAGLVRGVSAGTADITATVDGKTGTTTVTILSKTASVRASQDSVRVPAQGTIQLSAEALDASGNTLAGRTVTWVTLDSERATVDAGLVTWRGPGKTRVVARVGTVADTVIVSAAGDFAIAGAAMTQGVQDADGAVPMIAQGQSAAVYVLLSSTAATSARSKIVLRLTDASGALVYADTEQTSGVVGSSPTRESPTVFFLVPSAQLVSGRKWQVFRDPMAETPDDSVASDRFPRAAPANLALVNVPPLAVRFVPITLAANNNTAPTITSSEIPNYMRTALSVHPLGQVTTSVGSGFTTNVSFGTPPQGGASSFWSQVLSELNAARTGAADQSEHWYGVVAPPAGFNFALSGGIAYVPSSYGSTGSQRTAMGVRTGWFNNQTQARDLVAHELGHNFGQLHTPCNNPPGAIANYPHPGGTIGLTMHDVFSLTIGLSATLQSISSGTGDVMGYCNPAWASVFTYSGVLAFRGNTPASIVAAEPRVREPILIIQGSVAANGAIDLMPPLSLAGFASTPEPAGEYLIRGLDAAGRVLFTRPTTLIALDHADMRHFTIAIPADAAVAATRAIQVTGGGRAASLTLGDAVTPEVQLGPAQVSASCGPWARVAVQDAATGDVLGIGRGTLRLAARAGRQLSVTCGGRVSRRALVTVR